MNGKLIKTELGYQLFDENMKYITSLATKGLSLKNCQAIERGYDLDELVEKSKQYADDMTNIEECFVGHHRDGFRKGFQKALEILGDKKFTEENMEDAYYFGSKKLREEYLDFIKTFQQNEWEVTIEMEKYGFCEGCTQAGMWHCAHADTCGNAVELERPKLDEDGCRILKRRI